MFTGHITTGSRWQGTQRKHEDWVVEVLKVMPGRIFFEVIKAHASMKGKRRTLGIECFRLNYVPHRSSRKRLRVVARRMR